MAVTRQDFRHALRQTLDDRKLSRRERGALSELLEDLNLHPNQVGAFRSRAFDLAREAVGEVLSPADVLEWLEDVVKVLTPSRAAAVRSEACFSPGEACLRRIQSLFRHARRAADVCVFTITDNRITEEIMAAHHRGVRVRIVTDNDKSFDRGSDVDVFERAGIEVRVDRTQHHMHHKFALFDGESLLTGSYNWTRSASQHNEENLIVTDDQVLVREFSAEFEKLWQRFA